MRKQCRGGLAALSLVAAGATGCVKPSVYTTRNLTVPVQIGPVHAMRGTAADPGPVTAPVERETTNFYMVSSHQEGDYQVTTTQWHKGSAVAFDKSLYDALLACPPCSAKIDRIRVGAYSIYLLATVAEKNWAGMEASLHGR